MDGVVRSPSLFSMTRGLPLSMMATQELVVPRSMPITLPMIYSTRSNWVLTLGPFVEARPILSRKKLNQLFWSGFLGRHDHACGPQQPSVQLVALLHDREHRVRRRIARLRHHGLVHFRVERLPFRVDLFDLRLFECLGQQSKSCVLPFDETGHVRL